ncbi:MAG: hypothetical protein Q9220_004617 [cf. Caloplaca sp. 1 TL-2023]
MDLSMLPPGTDLSKVPVGQGPPGTIPNFVNPESTAGRAIAVTVLFTVLMFIFVCMRMYTKLVVSRSKGWDDFFMRGYSVHTWNFPISKVTKSLLETLNVASAFYGPTMFFTKLSLFILYYRLFSPSKIMRYLIYFGIGFNFLFYTIYLFLYALYCPNTSKKAATCGGNLKVLGVATSGINVVSDFYILLIPLTAVSNLQLPPKRKLGLLAIFFTGFLACLCSIISLHYRIVLSRSHDDVWNVAPVLVIGTVEFNIGIICCCLPTLPALFRRSGFSRKSKPSYMPDSGNSGGNHSGASGGPGANGAAGVGKKKGFGRLGAGESGDSVAALEEGRSGKVSGDGGGFELKGFGEDEGKAREWFRQARM